MKTPHPNPPHAPFWSVPEEALFGWLHSTPIGLASREAAARLARFGANRLGAETRATPWILLLRQFKSPIILILIGAAILSLFLQDPTNAGIIL
ncbi:MAG: cation-transporting P-type ATPase, partial [Terrimicrobiaceae bacterium]|nr:cation-transporting P-type ATPase [Terrimicrobiaceae bacterium]